MKTMTSRSRVLTMLFLSLAVAGSSVVATAARSAPGRQQYRVDAKKSRFIVETETSGLSSMFAHDHKIEIGAFTGTASFVPGNLSTGTLEMTVRADSLKLLEENNLGARQAVESALREDVLEASKYPEITFKTRVTKASRRGDGTYDVRLTGQLNLHGVRKQVTIPARVSVDGSSLHAIGVFEIKQTDYDITPFSFVSGTVTIKDAVVLSFDITADAV